MLKRLQEFVRRSGYFLPAFLCIYIQRNPRKWLIILKYFLWNLMDIVLFIKALQHSYSLRAKRQDKQDIPILIVDGQ